jgi:signal transduction histidine kinase
MRRRAFGLRPRLLIALVLTAVLTLGVAALALLSPLENRLRTGDEQAVQAEVTAFVPRYEAIHVDAAGVPHYKQLKREDNLLHYRADAQITLFDSNLKQIDQTKGSDIDTPAEWSDVERAIISDRPNDSLIGDDLYVAQPLQIGHQRFGLALRRRLTYVANAVNTVQNAVLEAAGAGLLVAVLLGVGFSSTLLRRLERLRDATRDLERRGPDALPPHDPSRDEIGELTRAFAGMQQRLGRQEAARRAFVATASHELRTPLASLDGLLELLNDDLDPEHLDLEDARDRAGRAKEQIRRLSALAGDLLDLSRLDAEVKLRTEPLELRELCRAVAAEFDLRARAAGVLLDVRQPPRPCWAVGDPGSVARIIRILIDNALRAAPHGSTIEVSTAAAQGWCTATVTDSGPGVPDDERELIFERFQRGRATAGRSGFGLGLAIGRELAGRMEGTLELVQRRPRPVGGSAAHYGTPEHEHAAAAVAGSAPGALARVGGSAVPGADEATGVPTRGPGASFRLMLREADVAVDGGVQA